jgi:hypothetical protein
MEARRCSERIMSFMDCAAKPRVWMSAGDVGRYVRADQSKELAQLGSLNRLGPPSRYALLSYHVPKT